MYRKITFLARGVKWGFFGDKGAAFMSFDKAEKASPPKPFYEVGNVVREEWKPFLFKNSSF